MASADGAALLLVVRLALAGAEVVMKEDVCASSTSSPSESSKNSFPTSSAIRLFTDWSLFHACHHILRGRGGVCVCVGVLKFYW